MTENLPALSPVPSAEIVALARRYRRASSPLMTVLTKMGGVLEGRMALLPMAVQAQIEAQTRNALLGSFAMAHRARGVTLGRRGAPIAAAISGAMGGAGGMLTSVAELPVTVTLILHAIQQAARDEGFDPAEDAVRAECLRVFAAGSPLAADDGINTAFFGARMTLTGPALQRLLAGIVPKLAAALGQKLVAQAVPVLGALSGAAVNAAFLQHYRELARIRFALLRLSAAHGVEPVLTEFAREIDQPLIEAR